MQNPDSFPDRTRTQRPLAGDDETGDGKLDWADLKHQLDRIEAQLAQQDAQNRALLRNQRRRLVLNCLVLALVVAVAIGLFVLTSRAYDEILQASSQVNTLATTLQDSLSKLDTEELDAMMQTIPDLVDQMSRIDVDALNNVLQKLPALMQSVQDLQAQTEQFSSWFSGLGSLFGGGAA